MSGISGHADMNMILDWIKNIETPPKMVFVNHGGDGVCDTFAEKITKKDRRICVVTDSGVPKEYATTVASAAKETITRAKNNIALFITISFQFQK